MNESPRKLLSLYLGILVALSVIAPMTFTGVAAAAGNVEGRLAGGVANQPTATQQNPAVANMPTAVIAQSVDADVTVGWDYSPMSETFNTSPTELRLYRDNDQLVQSVDISSYSGTTTMTIPSSQHQWRPQQEFELAIYNPNAGGPLATDSATLEVRTLGSPPAVDMRNFTTKGQGNTRIQVGYDASGLLGGGKSLKIRMVGPNGNTSTTSDLSADPRGAATMTVPSDIGTGTVTFELHVGSVDGTPDATATAEHSLKTYISAQSIEYVNGTKPTVGNIAIQSQTMSFGSGGMFQFTLTDATKNGFGNRDLSGGNVGADESTLLWVNFTVENYAPEVLMGPGDVERWQYTSNGSGVDISILVHPTSVYRNSNATGFDPSNWKEKWDMADYGLDASVSLAVSDIPGSLGGDLDGAQLTTDAQFYRPPRFQNGSLQINVAAPHCKDNATGTSCSGGAVNDDGFYKAVIPKSFWSDNWKGDLEADDLAGIYTSNGTTSNLQMTVSKQNNGDLVVNATNIHYSNGTIELEPDSTAPTADAGSDRTVNVDESVWLDGSSSSDNRKITKYEWDVDDDGTYEKTGKSVPHSYGSSGDKTVTLRVTDGNDNTDTDTVTVSVNSEGDDDDDDGGAAGGSAGSTTTSTPSPTPSPTMIPTDSPTATAVPTATLVATELPATTSSAESLDTPTGTPVRTADSTGTVDRAKTTDAMSVETGGQTVAKPATEAGIHSPGQPGFGVTSVLLAVILGALLAVQRRRRG